MIALDRPDEAESRYPEWQKRILDLGIAIPMSAVILPFCLLIAILVKATSAGPVLYRQRRVGRLGHPFDLYKFRSMRPGQAGLTLTADGDERITPIGRTLRKWKLDELPQLINVLRGEMSLVGPRPEVPEFTVAYSPEQAQVLGVKPGITGLTQIEFRDEEKLLAGQTDVRAFYVETILPKKLAMDLLYIEQRTLLLDIRILFRTLSAIFHR